MGHVLLGTLPKTPRWLQVVELVGASASASQVATATVLAAEKGLSKAAKDPGMIEAVWLLMQIPLAARSDNFGPALRRCGLVVGDTPALEDIACALTARVDAQVSAARKRTDLGEMAQLAAVETLNHYVGEKVRSLFGTTPESVKKELAGLATVKEFGLLANDFYARFSFRCLDYFLSRTLPLQIGTGKRFASLRQARDFEHELEDHCRASAKVMAAYSGKWLDKHEWESGGRIERTDVERYVGYGMQKLTKALKYGAGLDVD